jgi:hypothetical protein
MRLLNFSIRLSEFKYKHNDVMTMLIKSKSSNCTHHNGRMGYQVQQSQIFSSLEVRYWNVCYVTVVCTLYVMTVYLVVKVFIQHHTHTHTHCVGISTVTRCLKGNMRSCNEVTWHGKSWGECVRGWRQWLKWAGTQFRAFENLHLQFPDKGRSLGSLVERDPRIIHSSWAPKLYFDHWTASHCMGYRPLLGL